MKTLLFLFILFVGSNTVAQTVISGTTQTTGSRPVKGANISIKGSYDGASADTLGNFRFTTFESGIQIILFSAVGYQTDSIKTEIAGGELIFKITLKERANELNEVHISAGTFTTGEGKKNTVLNSIDVATTAGGEAADIFSALRTLPGTQTSSSENGFFVRGGAANETRTYFDGLLVKTPFGTQLPDQASRGRFSPFLFKGSTFSAGGYSAQYGQALSSVLNLDSKDLPEKTINNVSLMSIGGSIDQIIRLKNSSIAIGGSYINLQPAFSLLEQKTNWTKAPRVAGGTIQYKLKTGKAGMLKVYSEYSDTQVGLLTDNIENTANENYFDNHNRNLYLNSTYQDYLSDTWKLQGGLSYSNNQDNGLTGPDLYYRGDKLLHAQINVSKLIGNHSTWKSGIETQSFRRSEGLRYLNRGYNENLSSFFTEADIFITDKLVTRAGLRAEYSVYLQKYSLAPRTSIAYKTGKQSQVSFAYGRFFQSPEDDFLVQSKTFEFENADHYIFNYQQLSDKTTFRVEAYYKDYKNLSKVSATGFNNSGNGYARGIDIFWRDKKSIKAGDYWISYSFLDARRNYKDYPSAATPEFAARHTLNIVYKQWIPWISSQIGTTYTFASGRTYADPGDKEYRGSKTPNFNNLSMNISYLTKFLQLPTVVYASVSNLPGFKNVFGYHFSSSGQPKQEIIPPAKRNVFIGVFITIGDDAHIN